MRSVSVRGASDDLIEVEGDLREEFNFYSSEEKYSGWLAFSDGTLASIAYDGFWRMHVFFEGKDTKITLERADGSPIKWVTFASGKENCVRKK